MRFYNLIVLSFVCTSMAQSVLGQTTLPKVFSANTPDKTAIGIREQAKAASQAITRLYTNESTVTNKDSIRSFIFAQAGVTYHKETPLNLKSIKTIQLGSFRIENIRYQSQPGVYVTASLYVPEGTGPFPAVVNMHGHWPGARRTEIAQTTAQLLAQNGYVCINVDAWGAGERSPNPHMHEYHGSALGASLLHVGSSLLGQQLTDNIRAVDLLCSLPYVDSSNIGATGASGGGNQTMWLAAADNRIKAIVPVVSIGTFESYIMNSNCFCELLPSGLCGLETWTVLGSMAPRPLKILTAMNDANPAFTSTQMLRSFKKAKQIYASNGAAKQIEYELFNSGHGYWNEMQISMLSWFNQHLKNGSRPNYTAIDKITILPEDSLATYMGVPREIEVTTTAQFCREKGQMLRKKMFDAANFPDGVKRSELINLTGFIPNAVKKTHPTGTVNGWEKIIIETEGGNLIPLLIKHPSGENRTYNLLFYPSGKDSIPDNLLAKYSAGNAGVVLADLWGTGEKESAEARRIDGSLPPFHTLSRSLLWLGKTIMGNWIEEVDAIQQVIKTNYQARHITLCGYRETAVAILLHAAITNGKDPLILEEGPISYLFDQEPNVNFYNMSIYLPGFLVWGDISLAASLTEAPITVIDPRSISGRTLSKKEQILYGKEFMDMGKKTGKANHIKFIYNEIKK